MEHDWNLAQFIGSECFYFSIDKKVVYTEGIRYLADKAQAYWLIEYIAIRIKLLLSKEPSWFYSVTMKVTEDNSAIIQFSDGNKVFLEDKIPFTDFPLKEIKLYLAECDKDIYCLMLPSEY